MVEVDHGAFDQGGAILFLGSRVTPWLSVKPSMRSMPGWMGTGRPVSGCLLSSYRSAPVALAAVRSTLRLDNCPPSGRRPPCAPPCGSPVRTAPARTLAPKPSLNGCEPFRLKPGRLTTGPCWLAPRCRNDRRRVRVDGTDLEAAIASATQAPSLSKGPIGIRSSLTRCVDGGGQGAVSPT